MLAQFDIDIATSFPALTLIGVDEAGRGPLAGPVTACACYIPPALYNHPIMKAVNDSKKLSHKKRMSVAQELKTLPIIYCLGFATAKEIDSINILQATFLAMHRALRKFEGKESFVLVDGNKTIPLIKSAQRAIIGGDAKSLSIAAASILAKTARDGFMEIVHKQYPLYNFEGHKGYGCAQHIAAIRQHGPCPQHRMSFEPLASLYGGLFGENNLCGGDGCLLTDSKNCAKTEVKMEEIC